ncbi:TPA: M15 family metallopeptidase, partial [Clostridioides difficile]|nr:M15 family metallopeptidase [Clostridioides difficile]HEK4924342.1 M15 family metallopeptidase [Clostridioides difficile]
MMNNILLDKNKEDKMTNTILLTKDKVYDGNLILVNAFLPVKTSEDIDLIPVDTRFPSILMKREATNILQNILKSICGINEIVPVSGYRTAEEQQDIYSSSLRDNGKDFTKKFVALPNHSEHQTGLAIDLGLKKEVIDFICPEFPYNGICNEFRKAALHYGFIERYQCKKEEITGISQEPWHFRYVGYPHSEIINKMNLALEEYIEYIKRFSYTNCLKIEDKEKIIEIFYVPIHTKEEVRISIPEQCVYQISGNNKDGFIV